MKVSLATEMAPPFILVAHYFVAALIFLLLSSMMLPSLSSELEGHFISTYLASYAHLYLLGFVMMTIFGAMYQLLPVVLEAPIFSKDFAYVQCYMYAIGLSVMVLAFGVEELFWLMPYGALMTYMAMLIFCANVFLTFYALEAITLVGKYLLIATLFLLFCATIGLLVGFNLTHGFLPIDNDAWVKAHILGTLGGFVMMVVMGVAMVLLPMFSLAHGYSQKWSEWALPLHVTAMVFGMLSLMMGWENVLWVGLFMGVVSSILFIIQMVLIMKHRVRKQNDYWAKNIFFALGALLLSLGTLFVAPLAGGILFAFGFLLPFIVGHIYKILPFLVWYEKFSPLVGKQKVPMLHQMIHTVVADTQTWILFGAVVMLFGSVLLKSVTGFYLGAALNAASMALVAYNAYFTFTYKLEK